MNIGIDFGTSYSAAATYVDGELTLVRFGDARQFRTAVFFPEVVPDPNDFRLTPELDAQGLKLVGGRLLPGPTGPASFFMYENAAGERFTIYASRAKNETSKE